jgi:choline-sulfatase
MPRRPNILLIMADQLAPQFLGAYGHAVVRSPHIDALAARGVVFDSAYCNAPLCAPARYVMMTGRLPSRIGAWDNAAELSAEIPTFAHYLSSLGYRTCLTGKMHFCGPDQLHGFHERLTTDVYPSDFAWTPDWDDWQRRLEWFHTMDVVREAGACTRSGNLDYDDEVAFTARRWLFDAARGGGEEPFCLVVSFINPHDPYTTRPEYLERHALADIDMPATGPRDIVHDAHAERVVRSIRMLDPPPSEDQIREARRAYYGSVAYIDDRVGELLATLKEARLADDTIVILTSDHGDMLGERGMWFKMHWYDHAARVPLIIAEPGAAKHRRIASSVSHVDLLPTLVELATGGNPYPYPTPVEGRSLLPHMGGAGHDEAIGEYFAEGSPGPVFMIRRGETKAILSADDPMLLYRLTTDPPERDNRANDPAEAAAVDALRREFAGRWDVPALRERVLESQRRRRWIAEVMKADGVTWDHQPIQDASNAYIRNTLPLFELERRARFP